MTDTSRDTPNVILFPPMIPLSILVAGVIFNFFMPLGLLAHVLFLGRIAVGAIAFVVGIGMVIAANRIFRRIGTDARPSQPTLALATTGMFTWTRNPMYVGGSLALLGIAIRFRPRLGPTAAGSEPAARALRYHLTRGAVSGTQVPRRIPALQDEGPTVLVAILIKRHTIVSERCGNFSREELRAELRAVVGAE